MGLGQWLVLLRRAAVQWSRDNTAFLAAGLAFHTMLALSPLLLVLLAAASAVFAPAAFEGRVVAGAGRVVGPDAAKLIQDMIVSTSRVHAGSWASFVGLALAVVAGSNVMHQMKYALNTIWHVPQGIPSIRAVVLGRFHSVAFLTALAFVMLSWLLLDASMSVVSHVLRSILPERIPVLHALTFSVSVLFNWLIFGVFYRLVPDAPVAWRDVVLGGLVAAVLFTLGKSLLGAYFHASGVLRAYGAAASVIAVLLWLYLSGQIFLFGAEVCVAYAQARGSRAGIAPTRGIAL